ncbi:hypothetical protein ACMV5I_23560 [Serratia sp. T13T92]|uniref:hypothetical protein n=1 Tax=Serratia sp. T13T92 TaxID=3397496 RepID=UPI0039E0B690
MKRLLVIITFCSLLVGCASELEKKKSAVDKAHSLQEKRDVLLKYSATAGWSADRERDGYLKYGAETDSFLSGLVSACYANEYRDCVKKYYDTAWELAYKEDRRKCFLDAECKKNTIVSEAQDELNKWYYILIANNQFQTGEADRTARMICDAVAKSQSAGMPYEQTESIIRRISGIEPVNREMLIKIGFACWDLSYYGYDPITSIRPVM